MWDECRKVYAGQQSRDKSTELSLCGQRPRLMGSGVKTERRSGGGEDRNQGLRNCSEFSLGLLRNEVGPTLQHVTFHTLCSFRFFLESCECGPRQNCQLTLKQICCCNLIAPFGTLKKATFCQSVVGHPVSRLKTEVGRVGCTSNLPAEKAPRPGFRLKALPALLLTQITSHMWPAGVKYLT